MNSLKDLFTRYESYLNPSFFVLGFLFDLLTLGRIDDPLNIISQSIYLTILGFSLYGELIDFKPQKSFLLKIWPYKTEAIHFLYGSLLSAYTIFYFKSSSFSSSFIFLLILTTLLFLNEFEIFKGIGTQIRTLLFSLSVFCFFGYTIPILVGKVGLIIFILSALSSGLIGAFIFKLLKKNSVEYKNFLKSFFVVNLSMIVFYIFKIIPPVPLSIEKIGVYRNIIKTTENGKNSYEVTYNQPWYKFYENGEESFIWNKEDKIYVMAGIFSPGGFADTIYMHWQFDDPKRGWLSADKIPVKITGGREEGFRGYSFKSKLKEGDWRVLIETQYGRVIGQINFDIEKSDEAPKDIKKEFF